MIEFSLLCLERWNKEGELGKILPFVDSLHLDIMDGNFVKNRAFEPEEINKMDYGLKKHVHIMAFDPENYIKELNHVDSISFHYEAVDSHLNIIKLIKNKGIDAGLVINPETPVEKVKDLLKYLDRMVLMAVVPGFSGQKYLQETSNKIIELRKINKEINLVIDGGMHEDTIREVMTLGANSCVVCSVIVKSNDYERKIKQLKKSELIGKENRKKIIGD